MHYTFDESAIQSDDSALVQQRQNEHNDVSDGQSLPEGDRYYLSDCPNGGREIMMMMTL